jgi:hypothetical protein
MDTSDNVPGCFTLGNIFRRHSRAAPSSTPSTSTAPRYSTIEADTTAQALDEKGIAYTHASCCSFGHDGAAGNLWRHDDKSAGLPSYVARGDGDVYRPEVLKSIEDEIERVKDDLRTLSLDIHAHPEIMFKEKYVLSFLYSVPKANLL